MNAEELSTQLRAAGPPLFECSPAPRQGIRVRTPFLYPDGGIIDVFVLERQDHVEVTDFGEALGWLRLQSPGEHISPKQNRLVEDVCLTLGVELCRGQLVRRVHGGEISGAVLQVAQSVLRVADLWFTKRTRAAETVADGIGEWLTGKAIPFERSVTTVGQSGRVWTVNYQTRLPQRTCLVFLLTARSRAAARRVTEHVMAALYDLNHLKLVEHRLTFVSLFDDTEDLWEEADFRLVEDLSSPAR